MLLGRRRWRGAVRFRRELVTGMGYSDEERERILQASRAAIERVDAAVAQSPPDDDLAIAMRQPVEDRNAQWRREAEDRQARLDVEKARRALHERERAAADTWAEVDRRIAVAIEEYNRAICGPDDEAEAATCSLADAGVLVNLVVGIKNDIAAQIKPLQEELAKLREREYSSFSKALEKLDKVHDALVSSNRSNPDTPIIISGRNVIN